jgi:hypothetical protein
MGSKESGNFLTRCIQNTNYTERNNKKEEKGKETRK